MFIKLLSTTYKPLTSNYTPIPSRHRKDFFFPKKDLFYRVSCCLSSVWKSVKTLCPYPGLLVIEIVVQSSQLRSWSWFSPALEQSAGSFSVALPGFQTSCVGQSEPPHHSRAELSSTRSIIVICAIFRFSHRSPVYLVFASLKTRRPSQYVQDL